MTTCPSCRAPLATGQEYCLECGARVTGTGYGRALTSSRALRYLATAVVALIGAAVAIAATGGNGGGAAIETAIGGFATAPQTSDGESPVGPTGVAEWPTGEDGWTIALASLPQTGGRPAALDASARRASEGIDRSRPARLVAICELAPGLLDRLLGHLRERGRSDERPRGRAALCAHGDCQARRPMMSRCLVGRLEIPTL